MVALKIVPVRFEELVVGLACAQGPAVTRSGADGRAQHLQGLHEFQLRGKPADTLDVNSPDWAPCQNLSYTCLAHFRGRRKIARRDVNTEPEPVASLAIAPLPLQPTTSPNLAHLTVTPLLSSDARTCQRQHQLTKVTVPPVRPPQWEKKHYALKQNMSLYPLVQLLIEDTGTTTRPSTRQSYRWNARTLDADCFSDTVSSASVAPGTAEDMATSLMSVITGACDASMSKANPHRRREPVYWWTAEIADLRRSCLRARRLFQRSRGRHDEETTARELRLCKASSARGDQDQQASVLEAALRQGRQRRLGQTIQGCHVAPRMPAGQAAQLPSPGARRGGGSVSTGAERARPAAAASSGGAYTGRYLGGTQRSSVEDQGALRARPGWHTHPTRRSRSLLLHDPTSSCGCTRRVWRPAYSHLSGSARGLS
ncbi:unnamed protein product [Trichogramma brassicae]|uniref:Uncharacterized protein n=1 Tax=Trichogramma brassicae TaxID=86971 RepID=A0A6H5HU10_9HYME|nr:unnamed protein product [Trichogramma brassicae]